MEFSKVLNAQRIYSNKINYIWDYYPSKRYTQDKISKDLIVLKNLNKMGKFGSETKRKIDIFAGSFSKYFIKKLDLYAKNYVFCLVPPHIDSTDNKNGVYILSRYIRMIRNYFNRSVIIRVHSIQPLHRGGNRSIDVQLASLKINSNVSGKRIVVMDDITTTGNSLEACKILLRQAGAKEVILFAFAKTK